MTVCCDECGNKYKHCLLLDLHYVYIWINVDDMHCVHVTLCYYLCAWYMKETLMVKINESVENAKHGALLIYTMYILLYIEWTVQWNRIINMFILCF